MLVYVCMFALADSFMQTNVIKQELVELQEIHNALNYYLYVFISIYLYILCSFAVTPLECSRGSDAKLCFNAYVLVEVIVY